jgi:NADPH-dependent ferric siderophore reductase
MTDHTGAPARPGRRENEALAERLGVLALSLRVERAVDLTPSCRRVEVAGDDLAAMDPLAGQDLMIFLDGAGNRVRRRRYTIRHFDRGELRVDLDIALHGDGPGMRWAAAAEPGQRVEAIGPRGKVSLDPGADWHLFVGDDSFAPAALVMAEAVPSDGLVVLALEIDGPGHEQPDEIAAAVLGPRWVERGARPPGDPTGLLEAIAETPLPPGRGHAYVGGEHALVNRVRDALVAKGMEPEAVSHKPYWRLGQQNRDNGEPERD